MKSPKIIHIALIFAFLGVSLPVPNIWAGEIAVPAMPAPGTMVDISPAFMPAQLKGLTIHPENALKFDFIVTKGEKSLTQPEKQSEYTKLIKYFLVSLTVPDEHQWVNLSPYEKDRIIKEDFGRTAMGRDLLAQDYLLKQLTASLIYPEKGLGKEFWGKVYAQAQAKYGTTQIPVSTFNKVWIIPDGAVVYEKGNTVYVLKNHLKVMLEEDYLSLDKHAALNNDNAHQAGSQLIRQLILPAIEKEINEGKNFATLRQIYSSMVLAAWYKRALKQSFLGRIYADKDKIKGIDQDPGSNEIIYRRYLEAFKKGVFNYIKDESGKGTFEQIPRKYFSGGARGYDHAEIAAVDHPDAAQIADVKAIVEQSDAVTVAVQEPVKDTAMIAGEAPFDPSQLEYGNMGTIPTTLVPVHDVFRSSPQLKVREIMQWLLKFPADLFYWYSSVPNLEKVRPDVVAGINAVILEDAPLRDFVLGHLPRNGEGYLLPFATEEPGAPWTSLGRSLVREIVMKDGSTWSMVFKGALAMPEPQTPIILKPHRMSYSYNSKRKDGKLLHPQRGWVVTGSDNYQDAKNEVLNALSARAISAMFHDPINSQVPLGIFRLNSVPVTTADGSAAQVPVAEYFDKVFGKLSPSSQAQFLRYLRTDMADFLTDDDIAGIEKALWSGKPENIANAAAKLLKQWSPVIYVYLVKGDYTQRVERVDFKHKLYKTERSFVSREKIWKIYGFDAQNPPDAAQRLQIAYQMADKLAMMGYVHAFWGDYGARNPSLSPKDVTLEGTILDLGANMPPGAGGFLYEWFLYPAKTFWNLHIARKTLGIFMSELELLPQEEQDVLDRFNRHYEQKLDVARSVTDEAMTAGQKGGIDLNAANLDLQIKRDGRGIPLPLVQQDMARLEHIEGFIPIILEIKPAAELSLL